MSLKIRITGEGTKEEIISALQGVQDSLIDYDGSTTVHWEDATLFTEVSASDTNENVPPVAKCQELLGDALRTLNEIPNTPLRSGKYRNSYEVASRIEKTINR